MDYLYLFILVNVVILLIIVLSNFVDLPRITNTLRIVKTDQLVSVLIPARNEAENLPNLLKSLLNQSYKNIEILVYDDMSTDNTAEVVKEIAQNKESVQLISGIGLPEGWTGKNWACHNLSQKAKGDYLLFIDADVKAENILVSNALYLMEKNEVNALSIFPSQITRSFGERLVVPLMNFILLTYLHLKDIYKSKSPKFAAANGQFLLIEKNVYFSISGHQGVKNKLVEDIELARTIKKAGYKIMTVLGDNIIFCRMYHNFSNSVEGFTKNFFQGFGNSSFTFVLFLAYSLFIFVAPAILSFFNFNYILPVMLIVIMRIIISIQSHQNIFMNVFLHIPQMFIMFYIGLRSLFMSKTNKLTWKERAISA